MKRIFLFTLFLLFSFTAKAQTEQENTTYYFIRHAEKDRSDKTNKNPKLIKKGEERAEKWCETLKNINFNAVYSTNYNRTIETAQPTATKNNLEITFYSPTDIDFKQFKKQTKSKTVLIVGHSNTTPAFVNSILGEKKYDDIEDNNNANLYIVTIINNNISDQLLYIK